MSSMIHIGTSGFCYNHWKKLFYPADLPQRQWLEFYSERFACVEINNSFYRLPSEATLVSWRKRTPPDFIFVLKGSRYITHIKRLLGCKEAINIFYKRAGLLQHKLGPILWQLPPRFKINISRLKEFLDLLPANPIPVLEFRNSTWFTTEVYEVMEEKGTALCVHDMPSSNCPNVAVGPLLYIRFHGPTGRYSGNYTRAMLGKYVKWVKQTGAKNIYAFFNNDIGAHAIRNALTFHKQLVK